MRTIADSWAFFEHASVPDETPPVTREHIKGVFYSGAASLMDLIQRQHDEPDEQAMIDSLNRWAKECADAVHNMALYGAVDEPAYGLPDGAPDDPLLDESPDAGLVDHA